MSDETNFDGSTEAEIASIFCQGTYAQDVQQKMLLAKLEETTAEIREVTALTTMLRHDANDQDARKMLRGHLRQIARLYDIPVSGQD